MSRPYSPAVPPTATHRLPLWAAPAAALAAAGWGGNGFTPLVTLYEDAGLSSAAASLLFATYVVGLVPGFLGGGALSDRFGRRLVVWAVALTGFASVLLAFGAVWMPGVFLGRALSGLGLGACMTVATTWVRELSTPPYDAETTPTTPARRASLSLTAGFAVGPAVAGAMAQWGPLPLIVPYIVHVAVVALALALLARTPETQRRDPDRARVREPLITDPRRFWTAIFPSAGWVFGGMAMAFIVTPTLLHEQLGGMTVVVATALTITALGAGLAVQPGTRRRLAGGAGPGYRRSALLLVLGLCISIATLGTGWLPLAFPAAMVLGASYGVAMVTNLSEIQRIASPSHVGTATAVYYSLSYAGFCLPTLFSVATSVITPAAAAGATLSLALCCIVWQAIGGAFSSPRQPRRPS